MSLTESTVEDAALEWFGELGYAVGHSPQLAPGEPAAERARLGWWWRMAGWFSRLLNPAPWPPSTARFRRNCCAGSHE